MTNANNLYLQISTVFILKKTSFFSASNQYSQSLIACINDWYKYIYSLTPNESKLKLLEMQCHSMSVVYFRISTHYTIKISFLTKWNASSLSFFHFTSNGSKYVYWGQLILWFVFIRQEDKTVFKNTYYSFICI